MRNKKQLQEEVLEDLQKNLMVLEINLEYMRNLAKQSNNDSMSRTQSETEITRLETEQQARIEQLAIATKLLKSDV